METWVWIVIALICLCVLALLYGLIVSGGDYNRRCEEAEFRKQIDYERRVREQQRKKEEQNWIPEQKRDDSTWF